MGKKIDQGILFYRMNSGHTNNKKIRLLYSEHKEEGYWIWSCLIDAGYRDHGYYFDASDPDYMLLFADDHCKKPIELVRGVINTCIRRKLFDAEIYAKCKILTSEMMQEVYMHATSDIRRKGTVCEMFRELLLLPEKEVTAKPNFNLVSMENSQFSAEDPVNVPGKSIHTIQYNTTGDNTIKELFASPVAPPKKNSVKKVEEQPEPHWQRLVDAYFVFYAEQFKGETADLNKRKPRLFKDLVQKLKNRATKKNHEWSKEYAVASMNYFLRRAVSEKWMKEHFTLKNLVEQFETIYQRAALQKTEPKEDKKSSQEVVQLNSDIKYLIERYQEGNLDSRIIDPTHYDLIKKHLSAKEEWNNFKADTIGDQKILAVTAWIEKAAKTYVRINDMDEKTY